MSVITAPNNTDPIGGKLAMAFHQIVKGPALGTFLPSFFNPVPIGAILQSGSVGTAYSETISAQGGTGPYTFAVSSGTLPTGTSLVGSTGVISGTPTVPGTYSFTIQVTDANGFVGSQPFQIIIAAAASTAGGNSGFIA